MLAQARPLLLLELVAYSRAAGPRSDGTPPAGSGAISAARRHVPGHAKGRPAHGELRIRLAAGVPAADMAAPAPSCCSGSYLDSSVALSLSRSGHIPRWFAATLGVCLGGYVIGGVAVTHGSAVVRVVYGTVVAVVAAGLSWACRRQFRTVLAKPLPRRGPGRWMVTLPTGLMVAAKLACALAVVALSAVLLSLARVPTGPYYVAGVAPCVMLPAWAQAAAWLELRRRPDASPPGT